MFKPVETTNQAIPTHSVVIDGSTMVQNDFKNLSRLICVNIPHLSPLSASVGGPVLSFTDTTRGRD